MSFLSLWRVALHYGAMSGLLSFVVFFFIYLAGYSPFGKLSWLGAWIPVVFIVLATRFFKEKVLEGNIRYIEALKVGVNTVFSAAFLFALLVYIFGTLFDGKIVDRYKEDALMEFSTAQDFYGEEFMDTFLGKGATNETVSNIEATTLYQITFADFTAKIFGGFIVTLITSWIFSRKKQIS